ncbi:MAG: hypothetical protein HY815_08985 [Candidatus Riflebacteria bacterium]|nr:hypothetical protein [Candidatus Riflebacteria bacterium]
MNPRPARSGNVPGIAVAVVVLLIVAIGFYVSLKDRRDPRCCLETLLRLQARASLEWSTDSTYGPARAEWIAKLDDPVFKKDVLYKGLPGCPQGGAIKLEVLETALNVMTTYHAICPIHGDVAKAKETMGPQAYGAYLKQLQVELAQKRQRERAAIE